MPAVNSMLKIENLHKTYRLGTVLVHALQGVDLEIQAGEFVAIMGPSGSGKSTLMHLLGFLDKPDKGLIRFNGTDVTPFDDDRFALLRNQVIGFVFQQFNLLSRTTALNNVLLPRLYSENRAPEDADRAQKLLQKVGLGERIQHRPNELSGGQQQRVAVARALMNAPRILLADEPTGNLDSKSRQDIMNLLLELHAQGQTVIVVTHDDTVAGYATRIIRMMDGKVESDERKTKLVTEKAVQAAGLSAIDSPAKRKLNFPEVKEYFQQAFQMILSNKMRSLLSMLGVLIGVGCVIAMLALGRGARESIMSELSRFGSNVLSVRAGAAKARGVALEQGAVAWMTLDDAAAIQNEVPGIVTIAPQVQGQAQVAYGSKNWSTRVLGANAEYAKMRSQDPVAGRFFIQQEDDTRKRVVVLGSTVVRELFGEKSPLGETIKINRTEFQVIGILPSQGAGGWRDQDDVIVVPLTTAMYRIMNKKFLDQIDVQMATAAQMPAAQEQMGKIIMRRHRFTGSPDDMFSIRDNTQVQDALFSTTKTFSVLLGAVAAISLVVGGIGIMNIMLVSVTERTREIGLRKALGATAKDILVQFLVESIVITFLGGAVGLALGVITSLVITVTVGWAMVIGIDSILLAFLFSVTVGIVFGLWPARKASRMDPILALRYE